MTSEEAARIIGASLGLSGNHFREGRYEEALAKASEGLEAMEALAEASESEPMSIVYGTLVVTAVEAALHLEELGIAGRISDSAVRHLRELGLIGHSLAQVLNSQGRVKLEQGALEEAEGCFTEALDHCREDDELRSTIIQNIEALNMVRLNPAQSGESDLPSIRVPRQSILRSGDSHLNSINMKALATLEKGDIEDAERLFRHAIQAANSSRTSKRLKGILWSNLGAALVRRGNLNEAERALLQAQEILSSSKGMNEPLANVLHQLAILYRDGGRRPEAINCLKEAWDRIRQVSVESATALLILRDLGGIRLAERDFRRAGAILGRATQIYESMRNKVADSEEEHEGLVRVFRNILEFRLLLFVHQGLVVEAAEILDRAKGRFWLELILRMKGIDCDGSTALQPALNEVIDHRDVVGFNCLVINYFFGSNFCFAYFAFNASIHVIRLRESPATIARMVEDFRMSLMSYSRQKRWIREGQRLASVLLQDVMPEMQAVRRVVIMPDGDLWAIPFEALPAPENLRDLGRPAPSSPGAPLILGDVAPLSYSPSLSVLERTKQRERREDRRALVVAAPSVSTSWESLEGAEREAELLRIGLGGGWSVLEISKDQATRENFLSQASQATYLHFATHAVGSPSDDECFILLSDGRGREAYLHAREIAALRLKAELVVLTACCTATGKYSEGEGIMSLARAFLFAGCENVVGSLWPVDDRTTPDFVREFYQALGQRQAPVQAMRSARMLLRKKGFPPRQWAAFQIIGTGGPDLDRYFYSGLTSKGVHHET